MIPAFFLDKLKAHWGSSFFLEKKEAKKIWRCQNQKEKEKEKEEEGVEE